MKFKLRVRSGAVHDRVDVFVAGDDQDTYARSGSLTFNNEETEHFLARMMVGDVIIETNNELARDPIEDNFPGYDQTLGGIIGQGKWGDKPAPH